MDVRRAERHVVASDGCAHIFRSSSSYRREVEQRADGAYEMSDTPRTDKFMKDEESKQYPPYPYPIFDFARQLERELATTKLALANLLSDGDVTDRNHARMLLNWPREHVTHELCWCEPTLEGCVWVHKHEH
jgi:hypothetical protein